MAAIEANLVSFSYGGISALRDLDLEVPDGALYAMLGPNGSGKPRCSRFRWVSAGRARDAPRCSASTVDGSR